MLTSTAAALAAGLVAGLGVALPLGAVGVLLLQEGMLRGRRSAVAGATAVATVDLAYATVAVLAGELVTRALDGREREVRLVCALVLAGLGLHGLAGLRTGRGGGTAPPATRPGGAFWRFLGLTALNPLTAVYFAVLAAGLGERVSTAPAATAFVVGVFAASLAWQCVLALTGSALGSRLPPHARTWTSALGYGVVFALAAGLAGSA